MSVPLKINEEGGRKREFIFVEKQEVNRTRETNIKTLPGTRKLHCVRSTGMENHLDVRMLSCYCQECKAGDRDANQQSQCTNRQYVSHLKERFCSGVVKLMNPVSFLLKILGSNIWYTKIENKHLYDFEIWISMSFLYRKHNSSFNVFGL